jgi:hypothetical protein
MFLEDRLEKNKIMSIEIVIVYVLNFMFLYNKLEHKIIGIEIVILYFLNFIFLENRLEKTKL